MSVKFEGRACSPAIHRRCLQRCQIPGPARLVGRAFGGFGEEELNCRGSCTIPQRYRNLCCGGREVQRCRHRRGCRCCRSALRRTARIHARIPRGLQLAGRQRAWWATRSPDECAPVHCDISADASPPALSSQPSAELLTHQRCEPTMNQLPDLWSSVAEGPDGWRQAKTHRD